jgi:hypothetical protein
VPDLRYHLISLISVFLALAIGIMLGVAMADRGVVSDRMEAEITSIQRQFAQQQKEIGKRDEQIAEQQGVLDGMSEVIVANSLQGIDAALVTGPYADLDVSGDVQSDLDAAGANIISVETLDPPEPTEVTLLENTSAQAMTPLENRYTDFAREILGLTGKVHNTPDVVVFVGGGEIPALFKNVGIPSVTNADEPAGRAAIIECAATEGCEGTYGTKESATDPFPSPS